MNKHHRVLLGVVAGAVIEALASGPPGAAPPHQLAHLLPPESPARVRTRAPRGTRALQDY